MFGQIRDSGNLLGPPLLAVWFVTIVALMVVHIAFAVGVWTDAQKLTPPRRPRSAQLREYWKSRPPNLLFVGPRIWTLATLLGGVLVALAYWLMHHSTLAATRHSAVGEESVPNAL